MKAKLTLNKKEQKKDGSLPICVICYNFSTVLVTTGLSVQMSDWDGEKVLKSDKLYQRKNLMLGKYLYEVNDALLPIKAKTKTNKELLEIIRERMFPDKVLDKVRTRTFISYIQEYIDTKSNESTKKTIATTLHKVEDFDKDATLDDIDFKWLTRFSKWMEDSGMKVNAYGSRLRDIRTVMNYCIDCDYTDKYPFRRFRIKEEVTDKRDLTLEQLIAFRDYPCDEFQQKFVDMFMLMVYMQGISPVDLFTATQDQIENGYLCFRRTKLGVKGRPLRIYIQPEAWEIINKYPGKDYLLSISEDYCSYKNFIHDMAKSLKRIGNFYRAGRGGKKIITPIEPKVSAYWARFTFASLASNMPKPMPYDIVQMAMGHARQEVTGRYIRDEQKKIDNWNRKFIDYLNEQQ